MQASGQYGVPPEVPQFVVGRVPSATAAAAASASAHSHMFSLSHDMPVSNSSQQNPNPHPPPPSQQQQQMVTQKIRLESDSREVVPSPNLNNSSNNNHNNNNNNNNSNTDSFDKQLVPVGNSEQQQVQVGAGEEDVLDCERGSAGNRWPRQETLALLKIRSEMDANFRDASLKGPLWEDVSRRLAELGYYRSAKKCKEKFENVHKYYKRTKEGRAGRQDGKSYKFFSQLEALYGSSNATINSNHNNNNDGSSNNNGNSNKVTVAAIGGGPGAAAAAITAAGNLHATATAPLGVSTREIINPTSTIKTTTTTATAAAAAAVISNPTAVHRPALDFSAAAAALNFSSDSSSEDEYDEPEESEQTDHHSRKRKRSSSMVAFFENLMKQVIEKQEAMQEKFLEAIEKREQDRMIREEAWKRQEIARLSREHELKSQERSLTATRDAALVAFLQKMTGQTLQIPQLPSIIQPQNIAPPSPPPPPLPENQHNSDHEHHNQECKELVTFDPNSKRWPKPEVLALIKLRSGMEQRYHEAGPKGPLWEEISQGMAYLGYSRSAKRCKEKWENINKYFRKAKESNKKRPENAKTCPYFHQLDALYRKKILGNPSKQNKIMEQGYEGGGHDQQNKIIMQEDQNLIEPQQQQHCESSREDNSAHTQPGEHGTASAATDILAIMPPPAGSETHAVTYHHERTSSSTTRDASFMAMVQKLAAPDPPEFNMSTSSNTE